MPPIGRKFFPSIVASLQMGFSLHLYGQINLTVQTVMFQHVKCVRPCIAYCVTEFEIAFCSLLWQFSEQIKTLPNISIYSTILPYICM